MSVYRRLGRHLERRMQEQIRLEYVLDLTETMYYAAYSLVTFMNEQESRKLQSSERFRVFAFRLA